MYRKFRTLVLCLILGVTAVIIVLLFDSPDPTYRAHELLRWNRFHRYDSLIREVAQLRGIDPMLIKAVVWRESKFQSRMSGTSGEGGVMQVTEIAAEDWIRGEKVAHFEPDDLFDAKTNMLVGTWYLARALNRWKGKDTAEPFALAEYNAGRSRVNRWVDDTNLGHRATADDLRESIDFPGTREYVRTILDRYEYYRKIGRL